MTASISSRTRRISNTLEQMFGGFWDPKISYPINPTQSSTNIENVPYNPSWTYCLTWCNFDARITINQRSMKNEFFSICHRARTVFLASVKELKLIYYVQYTIDQIRPTVIPLHQQLWALHSHQTHPYQIWRLLFCHQLVVCHHQ